ncbi:MAG: DUF2911 domain-containing protein [Bacteroidia bacterium]|nr:DUF2911 domain-containing protein [Bacteroidia bacterium]
MKKNLLYVAVLATSLSVNAQGLKTPAPSPSQTLKQSFALSDVTIEYSRPGVKGRTIYGDIVPFGKVWRTGANASTKITFGEDVTVEGMPVKAGTYALYSIPGADSWELMLYKDLTLGGNVGDYKAADELLRFKVKPTTLAQAVETFTINMTDITAKTAQVELCWDKTRVAFKLAVDIDPIIMKNIEKNVINDSRPYFAAASYYYENDKDQNLALQWADKAFQANPKAYWIAHLKAKIQHKLKDNKGAMTSAEQSMAIAKADGDDNYVRLNEKLIAQIKSGK